MKYIAHRGNLNGKTEDENSVLYIIQAFNQGFDVEVDVWFQDGKFYWGHDYPKQEIMLDFMLKFTDRLWCHAKDIRTLNEMLKYPEINCFFHQGDDCALTSHKQIWTYFNKELTENSILLKFEKFDNFHIPQNVYGICSDYIQYYKNKNA